MSCTNGTNVPIGSNVTVDLSKDIQENTEKHEVRLGKKGRDRKGARRGSEKGGATRGKGGSEDGRDGEGEVAECFAKFMIE